ncbi:hypothetical protein K7432_007541 [Basidiobolus ranarum]|uniref:Macro domain-containing protein n=1 Tax=Basidiobolus ranarum TaxID=34480 RepID=A0ABR2WTC3_9FUNG
MSTKLPHAFKLILCDRQTHLCEAWRTELQKLIHSTLRDNSLQVEVQQATFEQMFKNTKIDCVVSPANSFGLMDGGVDWYISEAFGGPEILVPFVQNIIEEEWSGEQNVGTSILINVDTLREGKTNLPKYVAHTPSMRIPLRLSPNDDIVYRCTWAFLNAVKKHNHHNTIDRIDTVLCTGFGTGTGRFPVDTCAKQMLLACSNFINAPANGGSNKLSENTRSGPSPYNSYLRSWEYARAIHSEVEKVSDDS